MKRVEYIFIILVLMGIVTTCTKIFKKERYIVATSPNNPPMEMIDQSKNIVGFDIDVVQQIAEKTGMNIEIMPVLKSNILHGLIDETYDIAISSLSLYDDSLPFETIGIDVSDPYLEIGDVLVVSEDSEDFRGLQSLAHKKVGIIEGSRSAQVLKDAGNISIREYSDIEVAFEDMARDTIFALSIDLPTAARYVYLNNEYTRIFKIYSDPLTQDKYVIAVKKGNRSLLNKINTGIERMQRDGSMDQLIQRWFFRK